MAIELSLKDSLILLLLLAGSLVTSAASALDLSTPVEMNATAFYNQVEYCKKYLPVAKLPPAGSCFGENTKEFNSGVINIEKKRLGYFKLDDDVNAVFHCDKKDVEMIVHNRKTGNTCFFSCLQRRWGQMEAFPASTAALAKVVPPAVPG